MALRGISLDAKARRRYPANKGNVMVNSAVSEELGRATNVARWACALNRILCRACKTLRWQEWQLLDLSSAALSSSTDAHMRSHGGAASDRLWFRNSPKRRSPAGCPGKARL
jgi:hypothetical protein